MVLIVIFLIKGRQRLKVEERMRGTHHQERGGIQAIDGATADTPPIYTLEPPQTISTPE